MQTNKPITKKIPKQVLKSQKPAALPEPAGTLVPNPKKEKPTYASIMKDKISNRPMEDTLINPATAPNRTPKGNKPTYASIMKDKISNRPMEDTLINPATAPNRTPKGNKPTYASIMKDKISNRPMKKVAGNNTMLNKPKKSGSLY